MFVLKKYKSPGPDIGKQEQREWVEEHLESAKKGVIYDRFPLISESIYGSILRGVNHLADSGDLYEKFKKVDPLIIYCRPPAEEVLSFKDGRKQMNGVQSEGEVLLEAYDSLMEDYMKEGYKVIPYNYLMVENFDFIFSGVSQYLGI